MADAAEPGRKERFDDRYAETGYHYGKDPDPFLATLAARFEPGQCALLPGDGEGRNGVWLATRGLQVTTFDLSKVGVEKALALAKARGVTIDAQVAAVESYPWPKSVYDVVMLNFLHLPPTRRAALHRSAWDALKPGGLFILQAFSPRQLDMRKNGAEGGPQIRANLYTVEMLRSDLPGSAFDQLEDIDVEFHGQSHHGLCAVLRVVARKLGTATNFES